MPLVSFDTHWKYFQGVSKETSGMKWLTVVTGIIITNWNFPHNSSCIQKKQYLSWDLEYQKQFFLGVPRNNGSRNIPGKHV